MAITRDDVIHTAIQLLQEVGLDGLTLRRLAAELGVSAPTLYWHVRDKRELLDLMAEQMVRDQREKQPPFPPGLDWWEKIAEGMRRQYQSILAYRDGARVVAGNRPTEASLPQIENFLRLWVSVGFSPGEALASILTFGDYIAGAALEHQSELERRRDQPPERPNEVWDKMKSYPTLYAAAMERMQTRPSSFEHGLGLLIAGLRARHAELVAEPGKSPELQEADRPLN
jgi:TetR/AcrR family tetracycline transcriptional repressor